MSDVFDSSQGTFLKNIRYVQKALQQIKDIDPILELNEALVEATQELNKMEIQYGMCQKMQMKAKINLYKEELRAYKRKVNEKQMRFKEQQQQLSDQLFDKQQQHGVDPLLEAKRQMYEAQSMSNEAANGIKMNNEKLMKNITKIGDINNQLTVAQKLLGSIKKKLSKNKYTLWATLFVLALVVIFVIYTYVA